MRKRSYRMERFLDKVATEPNTGCWFWMGAEAGGNKEGQRYGVFGAREDPASEMKNEYAHRWIWEQEHGPIPEGLQIDHVCAVKMCVNPRHLRIVTPHENMVAPHTDTIIRRQVERTHCIWGHEFTAENTYWQGPQKTMRMCKECARRRAAERAARLKNE